MKARIGLSCVIVTMLVTACGANLAGEPEIVSTLPPPPPPTEAVVLNDVGYPEMAPNVALGAAIFAERNCASCHGGGGVGDGELVANGQVPYPGNMADRVAVAADTPHEWFTIITNGNLERLMPPWAGSLNEQERWAVALYTYTLSYTPESVEAGETVFAANFAQASNFEFDNLEAMVNVSDQDIYDVFSDNAPDELTDDDIWDAVAYARGLSVTGLEAVGQTADVALAPDESTSLSAPTSANIAVSVINGTSGGELPEDVNVELYVLAQQEQGLNLVDSLEAPVADGTLTFDDITIDPLYTYVAMVPYRDRQFISEPIRGASATLNEAGELELPIEIYELTEDTDVINIERMVIQVTAQEDGLQVAQVAAFRNDSDRMFTSSQALNEQETQFGSTVMFLPPGAVVAGFTDPNRYIYSEDDFAVIDTQPVLPTSNPGSEHLMQVVYFLPYEDGAIIEHPLAYDVSGSVRLLVSPTGLEVNSEQIALEGEVQLGAEAFSEYASDLTLEKGDVVRYELSGSLARLTAASNNPAERWRIVPTILFTISGLTGAFAVGMFIYGRTIDPAKQRNRDIDELVAKIAELDAAHEAGTLNHDVWHQQRNELKAKLKTLMEATPANE